MKAVIYTRVSTAEQTTDNQLSVLREWASKLGHEIVAEFTENETAWKAGHQTELKRLFTEAARRRFSFVLVWALDRLTREGPLRVLQIVDRLKDYGCRLYSYQETWTLAPGEVSDILYSVSGWVARMESQRRSERTKAGMARARANGSPIGKRGPDKKKRRPRSQRGLPARLGIQRGF